jgi:hypothetical protein
VYRKAELAPSPPSEFELPFGGKLSADNRWVKMTQLIPWSEFESEYAQNFPTEKGAPAKSGVADLRYEMLNMPVLETSIDKAWGFSTYFFHTLIKQRQTFYLVHQSLPLLQKALWIEYPQLFLPFFSVSPRQID